MTSIQQKMPTIILVILVIAMILALTYQGFDLFKTQTPDTQEALNTQPVAIAPTAKPEHDITEFKLFGDAPKQTTQQQVVETESLPKTNLRLVLRGVSASNDTEKAGALIEGPNKETLKYAVNDTLPGNAKLKSVYQNRVVIERSGRLENLYFPDNESIGIITNEPPTNAQNNSRDRSYSPQAQQIPQNYQRPTPNLDTLSDQRKQEIKRKLELLRERMQQAPK